jgi:hypothetical protein
MDQQMFASRLLLTLPLPCAGKLPVAPSAVRVSDGTPINHPKTFEELEAETPRALATDEVPKYVEAFRAAAANAMKCGFDGRRDPRRQRLPGAAALRGLIAFRRPVAFVFD